ncbi:hypothetical protein EB155_09670, partial [archaeon]|nr:hypothetical protein [archaeon]NDB80118.1 hypothetical protein [archaeon]
MNFPNPWVTILSFIYIFLLGIGSFLFSKKSVEIYLEKFKDKVLIKLLEPIVGSIVFISSFG